MSCCTIPLVLHSFAFPNSSITPKTSNTCAEWCFANPTLCSGYTLDQDNNCLLCNGLIESSTVCTDSKKVQTARPVCYNNVCVAVDKESVKIKHGTQLYISSNPHKYISVDQTPTKINIVLSVPFPQNVNIVGPGTVLGDLPLIFGENITVQNNVSFEQCSSYKVAQAAILLHKGGHVSVSGFVQSHFAKSLLTVAPISPIGNTVTLLENSSVTFTGTSEVSSKVCAAAFSHVVGMVAIKCANKCFSMTQDLAGTDNLQLTEDDDKVLNINLTNLLNDFGTEYLIEFADGPTNNKSTPGTLAGIVTTVAVTLSFLTVVFHQRYFKFV